MLWYEKNIGKVVFGLGFILLLLGWMGGMGAIDGPGILFIDPKLMTPGVVLMVVGGIAHAISNWRFK